MSLFAPTEMSRSRSVPRVVGNVPPRSTLGGPNFGTDSGAPLKPRTRETAGIPAVIDELRRSSRIPVNAYLPAKLSSPTIRMWGRPSPTKSRLPGAPGRSQDKPGSCMRPFADAARGR